MTKPQDSRFYRRSSGEVGLWPILILIAFSGGLSSAFSSAHWAGESTIGKMVGLFVGFLAGLAAYFAFQAVATRLAKRSRHSPDQPPTFRQEFPLMLVYLGVVIGIIASINIASWLARLVLNHAVA